MKIADFLTDLKKTGQEYSDNLDKMNFLTAANAGFKALYDYGIFNDFQSKSDFSSYGRAFSFCYTKSINGFMCGFIEQTNFQATYGRLADDESFQLFLSDCDLNGTNFDDFFSAQREIAGLYGYTGILVDQFSGGQPGDLIAKGIYPYLTSFSPLAIWDYKRLRSTENNRPYLAYVKLKQDSPDAIQVWTDEEFQTYLNTSETSDAYVLSAEKSGNNGLSEIPFVFFKNGVNGESSVLDVAAIDANMARGVIMSEIIMKKAAFPMLLRPEKPFNADASEVELQVGVSQILGYDPETGAKPEWLAPEVASVIDTMLKLWDKKEATIYSIAGLSAIYSAVKSAASRSGESLRQLTRFLDAKLAAMVTGELEARRKVIQLWCKWQNKEDLYEEVNITHDYKFDTTAFITTISDILTEKALLSKSETAMKELLKKVVKIGTLSDVSIDAMSIITDEIDSANMDDSGDIVSAVREAE